MHPRTAFLFALSPATRSFISRTPRASCTVSMRIMFPRCRMTSAVPIFCDEIPRESLSASWQTLKFVSSIWNGTSASRFLVAACAAACLVFGAGCEYLRQDMASQPKNRPLAPSTFFEDGRSERPLVANTVARGSLANDELYVPKHSNSFRLPVNLALLERGEERYKLFCSPCHGLQGDGNGMIAMRGMKQPPTYHQDRVRQAPNGYFYDNITNGFGAMYGYSALIPPRHPLAITPSSLPLHPSPNPHPPAPPPR